MEHKPQVAEAGDPEPTASTFNDARKSGEKTLGLDRGKL